LEDGLKSGISERIGEKKDRLVVS